MKEIIFYKTSFNASNQIFWDNLNISVAALKEYRIAPLKTYFDGNTWIKSSDTNPMYIAEFGNCRSIIKPNSLNNIFENFFDREHPSIFGYSNLPNSASTLYVVDNEIDVLLLDSVQLSAISINKENISAFINILDLLKARFHNINVLINNTHFENLVKENIRDPDVKLFVKPNNISAKTIFQLIDSSMSIIDYLEMVNFGFTIPYSNYKSNQILIIDN